MEKKDVRRETLLEVDRALAKIGYSLGGQTRQTIYALIDKPATRRAKKAA